MKRVNKILTTCLISGALGFGLVSTGFAQASFPTAIFQAIKEVLDNTHEKVTQYKDAFEDYYGISDNNYTKPTQLKIPGFEAIRDNRARLANVYNQGGSLMSTLQVMRMTDAEGNTIRVGFTADEAVAQDDPTLRDKSLTLEDLLDVLTTPYVSADCTDCKRNVEKFRQIDTEDGVAYPYAKIDNQDNTFTEILSKEFVEGARANNKIAKNNRLNMNALLGPIAYPTSSSVPGSDALGFIRNTSELVRSIHLMPQLPLDNEVDNSGMSRRVQYLAKLYSYISQMSVGLSNLNQMYAKRLPNSSLGNKSQMEVEHDMVMRHMTDSYQNNMNSAAPITVQREMLFMLAEMNYQLYQNRLVMERILATNSVMELQNMIPLAGAISYRPR